MKKIAILGSTGSIGKNVIEVARNFPDEISIVGLAANVNVDGIFEQINQVCPKIVVLKDLEKAEQLRGKIKGKEVEVLSGMEGFLQLVQDPGVDVVVSAIMGAEGLLPTLTAIENGKDILLANKETLVAAGELVMKAVEKHRVKMIPIDSEHSAIFQCLEGNEKTSVERLVLTASGGPFRKLKGDQLASITVDQALEHPNWLMGRKITIDSATMMNKGLELIEARWLFQIPMKKIDVIIHPQSIIHSLVEFVDGSMLAQLGVPDMKIPIQYALFYPQRAKNSFERVNLAEVGNLEFHAPDSERFPALDLARQADQLGGTMPAVMNAANEVAVNRFLNGEISFLDIINIVKRVMSLHQPEAADTLKTILISDQWAREEAKN